MEIEELKTLWMIFSNPGVATFIVVIIGFLGLKHYLPTYFQKKAENLATKEDIGKITFEIEKVKTDFALALEAKKNQNQLSIVGIEKRIEIHQKAYILWRKLASSIHSDKIMEVCQECENWWTENCLFLMPNTRKEFITAIHSASFHKDLLAIFRQNGNGANVESNWDKIMKVGKTISQEVELPPINYNEELKLVQPEGLFNLANSEKGMEKVIPIRITETPK